MSVVMAELEGAQHSNQSEIMRKLLFLKEHLMEVDQLPYQVVKCI